MSHWLGVESTSCSHPTLRRRGAPAWHPRQARNRIIDRANASFALWVGVQRWFLAEQGHHLAQRQHLCTGVRSAQHSVPGESGAFSADASKPVKATQTSRMSSSDPGRGGSAMLASAEAESPAADLHCTWRRRGRRPTAHARMLAGCVCKQVKLRTPAAMEHAGAAPVTLS